MKIRDHSKLGERLERIWENPDFADFLKKHSKRPPLKIKAGHIVFYEGDEPERLYFIKEGFVKLFHTSEDGRDTVIYLYGPGSVLGIRALTSRDRALKHNVEALTNVTMVTMPRQEYLDLLTGNPQYLVDLLHVFIERLNYTERRLEGFILTDVTDRVADFLADLAQRFGVEKGGKIELPLRLTHQRIAEFVGAVRETVTASMQKLAAEGSICDDRGSISILNLGKLSSHSFSDRKL